MSNHAFNKTLLFVSILLIGVTEARAQIVLRLHGSAASAPLSDAQVVKDLTATNVDKASRAVREIMQRGGRMIPLLMKLKGNRQCFYGDMALGSHAGCSLRLMPEKRTRCYEESSASTLEVASLFLIEAIYHDDLKFAQGATLVERESDDGSLTDSKHNGRELLARAWAAVERWDKEFDRDGLETLRRKDREPFFGTRLGFY